MAIKKAIVKWHITVMLTPCIATAGSRHKGKVAAVQTAPQHQHGSVHALAHMGLVMRIVHGEDTVPVS